MLTSAATAPASVAHASVCAQPMLAGALAQGAACAQVASDAPGAPTVMAATLFSEGGEGERMAMPMSADMLPQHLSTPPTVRPHEDCDVSASAESGVAA